MCKPDTTITLQTPRNQPSKLLFKQKLAPEGAKSP